MKPREEGGVVDKRLNVYGTTNLKCVDLSICPDNLGTNTYVTLRAHFVSPSFLTDRPLRYSSALLVGEKGADLLSEELGIKIKTPHAPVPHSPVPTGQRAGPLPRFSA